MKTVTVTFKERHETCKTTPLGHKHKEVKYTCIAGHVEILQRVMHIVARGRTYTIPVNAISSITSNEHIVCITSKDIFLEIRTFNPAPIVEDFTAIINSNEGN
ncbi:MAG: hypothetical protein LBK47_04820 [Prevotellaceae bacterium]|jgi:hypothetical protein|nr:hypothetical protein [Prevotellaceae bacterium]